MASSEHDTQRRDCMSQLQELFAPPTAESLGKKGLSGIPSARRSKKHLGIQINGASASSSASNPFRDDQSWRKPRPNCHDYCDSCNCTEGDRLVCDRCPASFHLECLDPPLDSHAAPTGLWFCRRCTMLSKDGEGNSYSSSCQSSSVASSGGASSTPATTRQAENSDSAAQRRVTNETSRAFPTGFMNRSTSDVTDVVGWLATGRRTASPKSSPLSLLWDVLNCARFLNPKEFELPKDLMPGIKIPGSYKTPAERKANSILELENGQIPRPVRRCYNCARTCFYAPLLPCDYCTACFHLECLDPPLAQFPPRSDRWMCPLHAEHTVDKCLVRSIRLSERIRAWNQLSVFKPDFSLEASAEITDDVFNGASHTFQYGPKDEQAVLSAFLRNVRRRRLEACAAREVLGILTPNLPALRFSSAMPIVVPSSVKALYENPVRRLPRLEERSQLNYSLSPYEDEVKYDRTSEGDRKLFIRGLLEFYLRESTQPATNEISNGETEFKTSSGVSVANPSTPTDTTSKPPIDKDAKKAASLVAKIKDAIQELDNVNVPTELVECEHSLLSCLVNRPLNHRRLKDAADVAQSTPRLPSRAVITPCMDTTGPSVPMSYRQLVIGSGPDCHLCLANYQTTNKVQCPNVSPLHATIFYDEWSRHFELLNYSEFGSRVDSIPFKNDTVEKAAYRCEPSGLVKHVRSLIGADEAPDSGASKHLRMTGRNLPDYNHSCTGQKADTGDAGWESSAILHHGSVLQFGCHSFTFILVDWLKPPSQDVSTDSAVSETSSAVTLGSPGDDNDNANVHMQNSAQMQ